MKKLLLFLLAGTLSFSLRAEEDHDGDDNRHSSDIIMVSTQDDLNTVLKKNNAVVVKFMAHWCRACKAMKELDQKMYDAFKEKVAFVVVDSDKAKDLSKAYNISGIPTYCFFKQGQLATSQIGKMNADEYRSKIKNLLQ